MNGHTQYTKTSYYLQIARDDKHGSKYPYELEKIHKS